MFGPLKHGKVADTAAICVLALFVGIVASAVFPGEFGKWLAGAIIFLGLLCSLNFILKDKSLPQKEMK
ncbi:hypothetical protein [Roseibium sp. TrichSKD4]|uniref:hypothetical protein n=1 Tax=Roseibium sp. TrichSKD4 TaxID=744980 RepID=UPI00058F0F02|nr:hypothetical protein [Roseibium sp. TrichSKD4]